MAEAYLGRDMRITAGDLAPGSAGDVETVEGLACLRQDLAIRLTTPVGSWWLDSSYGTRVYRYLHGENTEMTRRALAQDLRLDAEADPRVEPGSAVAEVLQWDRSTLKVRVTVRAIGSPSPLSLVIGYSGGSVEVQ